MLLYNKKAELTTTHIVGLVVLILSFTIILFLIFQLNLGETTKKEVCKDSVILKGKSLVGVTPLNCQTDYVCFSKTNECDKLDNARIIKVASKNGLYRAIADEMADCWWMFGEGEINYAGSEVVPDFYCSFCSQIYFDLSVKEIVGGDSFSQKELYDFITTNKMSEQGEEYDEYLYDLNFSKGSDLIDYLKAEDDINFINVDLDKTHLVMMGITNDVSTIAKAFVAAVVVAGTVAAVGFTISTGGLGGAALAGVGALLYTTKAVVIGGIAGAYFSGLIVPGKSGNDYLRPMFIEKTPEQFGQFKCEHILTRS